MAKFHKGTQDGFKYNAYPMGFRGWWILFGRPLKGIPYSAASPVHFFVDVELENLELVRHGGTVAAVVYRLGDNNSIKGETLSNDRTKVTVSVKTDQQHDDGLLLYDLHIYSKVIRLVRSSPINDNFWFAAIITAIIAIALVIAWDFVKIYLGIGV